MRSRKERVSKSRKDRPPKIRLPLPKQSGGPIGPKQGDKSYDRKRTREELEREIESSGVENDGAEKK